MNQSFSNVVLQGHYGTFAQQVELSNLQVILEPEFKIWGINPNHIIVETADVIINNVSDGQIHKNSHISSSKFQL